VDNSKEICDASALFPHVIEYNLKMQKLLGYPVPRPLHPLTCTLDHTSELGKKISEVMHHAALDFELALISELDLKAIDGSLVEFGVFRGHRLKKWLDYLDTRDVPKRFVFGFDSFEGLPSPSERDYPGWVKGQFDDTSLDIVAKNLKISNRPHLKLVKGWLKETLNQTMCDRVGKIAFAMIDVDLYEPTVESLNFISSLIVDQGIIGFDDWAYSTEKSESAAFFQWSEKNPTMKFEFVASFAWRIYFKVHKK
jgi:hypothetical protein